MLTSHNISVQTEDLDKTVRYTKKQQSLNLSNTNVSIVVPYAKGVVQIFNLKTGRFRIIGY